MLGEILLDGLQQWFSGIDSPSIPSPTRYCGLLNRQSTVGWLQLIFGRFVITWAELQDKYNKKHKSPRQRVLSGSTWVTTTTTIIWKHVHAMWIDRNSNLHGADQNEQEEALYQ